MASYTDVNGTRITTALLITTGQGNQVWQAFYAGLSSSSGLVDQGFGVSEEAAIADLYCGAHGRQASGHTPDASTYRFR